jgi:hypothetical protein
VSTKVRYEPVRLRFTVGAWADFLRHWGFSPHKRYAVDIVFFAAAGGSAIETLHLPGAYCVYYGEEFIQGDVTFGSYVCELTLSDPDGFTMQAGGPGTFVTPAARDHGGPMASSPVAVPPASGIVSDCTESVRLNLQNQVKQNCKSGKQACLITDDCPVLEETMDTINACIAARTKINMKCFKGGDDGHKEQIVHKINGLITCQGYYARKCNKKPQPVSIPRRAPSTIPTTLPTLPKEAPLTVAGVGLFILYILSGIFRPGPI